MAFLYKSVEVHTCASEYGIAKKFKIWIKEHGFSNIIFLGNWKYFCFFLLNGLFPLVYVLMHIYFFDAAIWDMKAQAENIC